MEKAALEQPTVENLIRDEERNITYRIMAYRKLSRQEMVLAVRNLHSQRGVKIKRDSTYTIMSIIGFDE